MTNKTDDMPQVAYLLPHNHRVELKEAKIAGHDSPVLLFGTWSNAEGIETHAVKYTRSVEITDERVKEAENEFLEAHLDADLSIETQDTIKRALSDYGQMVECIRDMAGALEALTYKTPYILEKHADIIKKCRGKDNG